MGGLRIRLSKLALLFSLTCVASCGGIYNDYSEKNPDPFDRPADLKRDDFTKELIPKHEKPEAQFVTKDPPMPPVSQLLKEPPKPKLGVNKLVSLSVTEDVPLKDVFVELARLADIDIEVDPAIDGGVIFKAKNKPFDDVIERISDLAGLRYTVNSGVLRIEKDEPYIENYEVNFPNLIRSNTGSVSVNTGSGSSGGSSGGSSSSSGGSSGGSSGSGLTSGSSSSISTSYDGDLWKSIQSDIERIIGASASDTSSGGDSSKPFVTINRQAGMITISATSKKHSAVREYINKLSATTRAQVLIEAKIVEVALRDEYRSGVDWSIVAKAGFRVDISAPTAAGSGGTVNPDIVKISTDHDDLQSVIQLAQAFGTTRTLSSPRIMALNNQQAILSFTTNKNYYTLKVQTDTQAAASGSSSGTVTTTVDSTLNTIPVGIILTLQPSVDERSGEIMMNIRPTLSRLTGREIEDPAVAFIADQNNSTVSSKVPEIEVREMDSIMRVKSGEIMAIGGMIEQNIDNDDAGIPYAQEIPLLGNAFKSVDKSHSVKQTVIFLKATIVPSYGVDKYDQQFYNKFETDPRPVEF